MNSGFGAPYFADALLVNDLVVGEWDLLCFVLGYRIALDAGQHLVWHGRKSRPWF